MTKFINLNHSPTTCLHTKFQPIGPVVSEKKIVLQLFTDARTHGQTDEEWWVELKFRLKIGGELKSIRGREPIFELDMFAKLTNLHAKLLSGYL